MDIKRLKKLVKGPIYFFGPSGVGKSTIANYLAKELDLPVVNVSYMKHFGAETTTQSGMMTYIARLTKEDMVSREYQFLTRRANIFKEASREHNNKFISDRSYLDNLAFFILKTCHKVPNCEIENFKDVVRRAMFSQNNYSLVADPGYIIYVPYGETQIKNGWEFEDNKSRITNKYFQAMVGGIMDTILVFFKAKTKIPLVYKLFGLGKYIHYIPAFDDRVVPILTIDTSRNDGKNYRQIRRRIFIFLIIEAWRKTIEKRNL